MSKYRTILWFGICLIALTPSISSAQRLTGALIGAVTDAGGGVLPGVTVTLTGSGILGGRTFTTTETGEFRFLAVPPGTYSLEATLPGFGSVKRPGLIVSVGMTVTADIVMEIAGIEESVTVTGESPVVDVISTRVASNFSSELINAVPFQRDVYDVLKAAPGMLSDYADYRASGSIHGTGTRGTVYNLDGLGQADPAAAYVGTRQYTIDSFEDVEIMTGAMPAEVASATGGFVNIVTKSGGNEFKGGVSYYFANDSLGYGLTDEALEAGILPGSEGVSFQSDLTLQLGGPIERDGAWFYGSYRRFDNDVKRIGFRYQPIDVTEDNDDFFGKLTAQPWQRHNLILSVHHLTQTQPQTSWTISPQQHPLANWYNASKGPAISTQWQWVLSQSTFLETRAGANLRNWKFAIQPESTNPSTFNYATNEWTEAQFDGDDHQRNRFQFSTSISHLKGDFLGGDHELKAGFNWVYMFHSLGKDMLGGYIRYFDGDESRYVEFSNAHPHRPETRSGLFETNRDLFDYGWFVQDLWTIGKRLTLNLGLRFDVAKVIFPAQQFDASGLFPELQELIPEIYGPADIPRTTLADWKDFSPRLGLAFDLSGDGRTALKINFARYNEQLYTYNFDWPFDMRNSFHEWTDLNGNKLVDSGEFGPPISTSSVTPRTYPDSERPNWLEYIVGIEREILPDFNVAGRFMYKTNKDIYDNVDVGTYDHWFPITIFDTGPDGVGGSADDVGPINAFDIDPAFQGKNQFVGMNPEGAVRRYKAFELSATKRMSHNWQLYSSFVISRAEGNIGNDYRSTQRASAFNNPNSRINEFGTLQLDSTYQAKIGGTYQFPFAIVVGTWFTHLSGYPYTRTLRVGTDINGRSLNAGRITINAEPLGSRRLPSQNLLNLTVEKKFEFRERHGITLRLDGFNVTNQNTTIDVFSLSSSGFESITRILPPGSWRFAVRYEF